MRTRAPKISMIPTIPSKTEIIATPMGREGGGVGAGAIGGAGPVVVVVVEVLEVISPLRGSSPQALGLSTPWVMMSGAT
jgi:hypothetical protein